MQIPRDYLGKKGGRANERDYEVRVYARVQRRAE